MKMKIVRGSSLSVPVAILLISLPILVLMCAGPSSPRIILEIVDAESGNKVFRTQVWPQDHFSLEYIHSVHRSRVKDIFEIDQYNRIVLTGTVFSDHGAGMPYKAHHGGTFSILSDGTFHIKDMHMFVPEIRLRTGREYDNAFQCEDRRVNLSRRCGDALLIIRTRKDSILRRLFRSLVNA